MSEEINAIRNKVVQKFCRTVLWIDDDIHLDQGLAAEGPFSLFRNKYDEFTKSNLLCHMMEFPAVRSSSDSYASKSEVEEVLCSCKALALQSDIVIVDWMLGSIDSSEYAEEIVKHVVGKDKGFRFIVVLSNKEPEDSAFIRIDPLFKKEEDSDDLWENESGQFLLSLRKDEFKDKKLFDTICGALLNVYPDCLHLAALEIAGRIKDQMPRWLSNIPAGADLGMLVERGNIFQSDPNSWNTELQEGITENLLEDLSLTIQGQDLESLNQKMLTHLAAEWSGTLSSVSVATKFQDAFNALKKSVDASRPQKFSKGHYQTLSDWRSDDTVKVIIKSIETYAEFYDIRSSRDYISQRACPGCICEGLTDDDSAIAVCITAGCDCLRSDSLLFLVGKPMPITNVNGVMVPDYPKLRGMKGKKTVLRFKGVSYVFSNTADSIFVKNRTNNTLLNIRGIARRDILNRLIGRYMSHTQRFGVNQPTIVRDLRGENGADEE